jgi:hypothetical protein
MRDDSYDRLIESLQLELQIIRQNKQQLEAKLAQEQAQNVQFSILD